MTNKLIFTFFTLVLPAILYSQMNIGEMLKIYEMNRDQFQKYAEENGYSFIENQNSDKLKGVRYKKGIEEQTKFLLFQDEFYNYGKCVNYQTWSNKEYESLIEGLAQLGFIFFDIKQFESRDGTTKNRESYRNKLFELSIFITPNQNEGYDRHEISLIKF